MIIDLPKRFPVEASRNLVIGDRPSDIQAGHAVGLPGHTFSGENLRDFVLSPLANG
jgi:D-glycero-D-manno-heptose 1,7-bisphosphate phosphatase